MKLWQQIYFFTLILFIFTIGILGYLVVEENFSASLNREIERCYSEHNALSVGIVNSLGGINIFKEYEISSEIKNKIIVKYTSEYDYKTEGIYIEIFDSKNNEIYTNVDFIVPKERIELNFEQKNERRRIIRDIENKTYIFVSNIIRFNNEEYKLVYIRDISSVYFLREQSIEFFVKIGIIVILIVLVFLFLITRIISLPIKKIINSTNLIAKGNYNTKVEYNSKNELGILVNNFNHMIEMVNVNIKMLEKMNEQKKQFIDCFTHEIKTPITAIIGYAALLQTTKLDKKTFKDSLDFIYSEGKRLEELSISLMNLMFVQRNEYKMVKLDIRIIIEYVKRSMEMRLKKKKIELIIDAEGVFIVAEEQLIKMLFINLIDNAIKASDMGDKIIITVKDNNNEIVVSVKDFGVGIDNKHMEFITEPFYMVDKARSRENNGAGLGLAIVSKIVELHKGNIRIKSKKNEGTEIIVAFLKGGSIE